MNRRDQTAPSLDEMMAACQVATRTQPTGWELAFTKAALTGVIPPVDRHRAFIDRARKVLGRVSYKDWAIEEVSASIADRHYAFRVRFDAIDHATDEFSVQRGRPWLLTPEMTDAEIVRTALLAILTAEEHEARESFLFDGQPIFAPHFDLPS